MARKEKVMTLYSHNELGLLENVLATPEHETNADFVVVQKSTGDIVGFIIDMRTDDGATPSERTKKEDGVLYQIFDVAGNYINETNTMIWAIKKAADKYYETHK